MNKPTLKEKFDETIEDMGIHSLYQEIIWQWIEQYGKEQRIDELDNIKSYDNGMHAQYCTIFDEDIKNRIKELKDE